MNIEPFYQFFRYGIDLFILWQFRMLALGDKQNAHFKSLYEETKKKYEDLKKEYRLLEDQYDFKQKQYLEADARYRELKGEEYRSHNQSLEVVNVNH